MPKLVRKASRSTARAEYPLAKMFDEHARSAPVRFVGAVSEAGDQPQLRLVSGLLIAAGMTGRPRLLRAGVRMLLAHELATAIKSFIKHRVDRTRPRSAESPRRGVPHRGASKAKEESSFPSGHTAGAVAVAQAFSREFPEHASEARLLAAGIGLAQIPRCAHYPSDVGAGAIIGLAAEAAVNAVWDRVMAAAPASQKTGLPSTLPGGE